MKITPSLLQRLGVLLTIPCIITSCTDRTPSSSARLQAGTDSFSGQVKPKDTLPPVVDTPEVMNPDYCPGCGRG